MAIRSLVSSTLLVYPGPDMRAIAHVASRCSLRASTAPHPLVKAEHVPAVRSIILRKQDRGEADELVKFLSRDLGWLTGVAKNAKKSRVRFGGHLEPFALVDLFLRPRRKDEMVWIDDAQMVQGFLGLRSEIGKVARVAYFLELGSLFVPEGQPDADLFDFLLQFMETVEHAEVSPLRYLLDEILLLAILGFEPRFDVCPACGNPLKPGEDGVFSPSLGGACHRSCLLSRDMANLPLSPDTLAVVRRGLEVGRDASHRLRLNRKGAEELRAALSALVRYVRGEQINSLAFLETMTI